MNANDIETLANLIEDRIDELAAWERKTENEGEKNAFATSRRKYESLFERVTGHSHNANF